MQLVKKSLIVLCALASPLLAEDAGPASATYNPHEFATRAEGAVLPEKVMRARYVYTNYKGQANGYDKDGGKADIPLDVTVTGGAAVFEYGITKEISFQMLQKFVTKQTYVMNDSRALEYTANTRAALVAAKKAQICAAAGVSGATCDAAFAPNSAAVSSAVDAGTLAVVKGSEVEGAKGAGDLEVGALWSPLTDSALRYSVGSGFRFPMNHNLAASEASITRDAPEFAIRLNADYLVIPSLDLSWQNQSEVGIASGKYETGGVSATYTRKGVRNNGFFLVKPSLAGLNESLGMIGPKLGVTYDFGNEKYAKIGDADSVSVGARSQEWRYYACLNLDFFRFGAPLNVELEYQKSFRGKNVSAATDITQVQLKGYYAF